MNSMDAQFYSTLGWAATACFILFCVFSALFPLRRSK